MKSINAFIALAALSILFSISAVSAIPTISSYDISSSSISSSQPITVTGHATAQAGTCIVKNRFFIVGSQGGIWTNNSCEQSVSLNSVVPTADNPRSFYRNPGAYVARWEIVDDSGQVATKDIIVRVGTPDSGTAPSITSFIAPSAIVQGDRIVVSGTAQAASSCIIANRFYVVGSQGGVWTQNNCENEVSLNGNEPTLTNPRSFYRGTGSYTLKWEVLGADGFVSYTERTFTLEEESSSDDNGNGGSNPPASDTTAPAPVSSLALVSVNSTSATWSWTNPSSDFASALIYINGINVMNTSSSTFTAYGLLPSTAYTITIYTVDSSGNINSMGVSYSVTTLASPSSGSGGSSNHRNKAGFRYINSEDDGSQEQSQATVITARRNAQPISLSSEDSSSESKINLNGSESALLAMLISCAILLMLMVSVIRIRRKRPAVQK